MVWPSTAPTISLWQLKAGQSRSSRQPARLSGTFASGLSIADGLAFDKAGDLYVVDNGANLVKKFSPTGADLGVFASTGLSGPTGLVFDAAGNLYVANYNSGTVAKFSPTGAYLGTFASGLNGPQGLALDKSGNLYVTSGQFNTSGGSVEEFSSNGTNLGTFASTGLSGPTSLVFDKSGNLYVTNFHNNTVAEFSSTGGLPRDLCLDRPGRTVRHSDSILWCHRTGAVFGDPDLRGPGHGGRIRRVQAPPRARSARASRFQRTCGILAPGKRTNLRESRCRFISRGVGRWWERT